MKRNITLIRSVCCLFSITFLLLSCQSLEEDPKSILTPGNYFKSVQDLDAAVLGIYRQNVQDETFGPIAGFAAAFSADDMTTDPGLNKEPFRLFDRLLANGNNPSLYNAWRGNWQTIYQANFVLTNYENVPSPATEQQKKTAAGQAYFLRAQAYFMLVRVWGEMPIVTKPEGADYRPAREPVANVYELIVNDLKTAVEFLPTTWPDEPGRATKLAARSLLAEVYLTMAGWPLKQADKFALAAEQSKLVIESGQYQLVPEYGDVFTLSGNNSSESIFAWQFNTGINMGQKRYGLGAQPLDENGWEDYYPELTFYKEYPEGKRKDAVFYTTFKVKQPDGSTKLIPFEESHSGHPHYKKFREGIEETATEIISQTNNTNKSLDLIRYPLVLLNYAETSAMVAGAPTPEGLAAINEVRHRAGLADLPAGMSLSDFRKAVINERAWEFCGEVGIRWYDLQRMEMLEEILAKRDPKENPIGAPVADIRAKYLAPIPVNEMAKNPQWNQNPSY